MTTIVDSNLPVARPSWVHSRLESRIVHLGCGAFHRAHQALYTHHLLESTDSDWGICEVNLMPGNDRVLIENLKKQQLLYTVAEKGAEIHSFPTRRSSDGSEERRVGKECTGLRRRSRRNAHFSTILYVLPVFYNDSKSPQRDSFRPRCGLSLHSSCPAVLYLVIFPLFAL